MYYMCVIRNHMVTLYYIFSICQHTSDFSKMCDSSFIYVCRCRVFRMNTFCKRTLKTNHITDIKQRDFDQTLQKASKSVHKLWSVHILWSAPRLLKTPFTSPMCASSRTEQRGALSLWSTQCMQTVFFNETADF